jgi:hypothetical protein
MFNRVRKPEFECRYIDKPRVAMLAQLVLVVLAIFSGQAHGQASTNPPADRVYRNGVIFTADSRNTTAEAVAIRDGRIVYVGSNQGLTPFVGAGTASVDLKGGFLMPGLVDGQGVVAQDDRAQLLKCSLNYEALTVWKCRRYSELP